MQKYIFGADIGGTACKLGLFDARGTLLEKWEIPTDKSEQGTKVLPNVAAALQKKMAEKSSFSRSSSTQSQKSHSFSGINV